MCITGTWLGISQIFLLVKLYPEMNVCERMSISMTNHLVTHCVPLSDPMLFLPVKYAEVKGRRAGSRGRVSTKPQRMLWGLRVTEECMTGSPKELLIMQWEGREPLSEYWPRGKKGGRSLPLLDMPAGLSLLWSLSRRVLPESQICFYVVQFKSVQLTLKQGIVDSLVHFLSQGRKKKTSILNTSPIGEKMSKCIQVNFKNHKSSYSPALHSYVVSLNWCEQIKI